MCSPFQQYEEFYEKEWFDIVYIPFMTKFKQKSSVLNEAKDITSWDQWYYIIASIHPNLTKDFINQYPDKPRDWGYISQNPIITMEIINHNPNKPWNWCYISMNSNFTIDIINQHPDKPWNWHCISMNSSITIDIINQHPDKPWSWIGFSYNDNLPTTFIDEHPDYNWNWNWFFSYFQFFTKQRAAYVNSRMSRLSLLSMMDEDYNRDEGVLNQENYMDMVIQNEYIIFRMSQYFFTS